MPFLIWRRSFWIRSIGRRPGSCVALPSAHPACSATRTVRQARWPAPLKLKLLRSAQTPHSGCVRLTCGPLCPFLSCVAPFPASQEAQTQT